MLKTIIQPKKKEMSECGRKFEEIFIKAKDPEYQLKQKLLKRREENIKNTKVDLGI